MDDCNVTYKVILASVSGLESAELVGEIRVSGGGISNFSEVVDILYDLK